MQIKKKNPKKVKVVSVLVKYNLRNLDIDIYGSANDAEMAKDKEELKGLVCQIIRKQIR